MQWVIEKDMHLGRSMLGDVRRLEVGGRQVGSFFIVHVYEIHKNEGKQ